MNQPDIKDYISTCIFLSFPCSISSSPCLDEKVEPFLEHNLGETLHHEQTNFNDKKNVIINSEKTVNEYLKQYQQLQELKTVMEQSNLEGIEHDYPCWWLDLDRLNEQLLAAEVEYNSLARDAEILHTAVTDKIKHYTEMVCFFSSSRRI